MRASCGIKRLPTALDAVSQVGVADVRHAEQVDGAAEQGLELFLQAEIGVEELLTGIFLELDDQVDVAALRVEGVARRGSVDFELLDVMAAADLADARGTGRRAILEGMTAPQGSLIFLYRNVE